jgi:hypothetical protein
MAELAEKLMIKTDGPVLTQELADIRNQPMLISFGESVQIFDGKPHK